nr:facilitated trehalose transporter Tret1-2 homolog [Leptinotarsa decemlineata]
MVVFWRKISYTLLMICSVDLLATSGDITMSWTSPMLTKLNSTDSSINPLSRRITDNEGAWIGSLINIGAILGTIPISYLAEKFGRKIALLCIAVPHFTSYLSMAIVKDVNIYYFGRLFGGISVGAGYNLLPMYIAEIAQESQRGPYSVTLGIFWAFGNFLPYLIGSFLSVFWFNFVLALFPLAFFISFLFLGTETPYYLVKTGQLDKAEKVLMLLRSSGKDEVAGELSHIRTTLANEKQGNLLDVLKSSGLRKALIISVSLLAFQQFSGINAITFYLQPIFESSGTEIPSDIASLVVGACLFSSSLVGPYVIDKFGRKTLMISSCSIMALCLISMGAFFFIKEKTSLSTEPIFWLPITSLVLLILVFQIGVAAVPWTISSELFPSDLKQLAASATTFSCYFTSFIITKFFTDMTTALGTGETFWFFAVFSILYVIFTLFCVPETRGKTFMEIQNILRKTSIVPSRNNSIL